MIQSENEIRVYLEAGQKRTFAAALDWPGWCRAGRDEGAALQALIEAGPRYAHVLETTRLIFQPPASPANLTIVERLPGTATTDFGAPDVLLPSDADPVQTAELERWKDILIACWQTFALAEEAARGKSLRTGPRGGGRDLEKITAHVREVEAAYLGALGGKTDSGLPGDPPRLQAAVLAALAASARGEIPEVGPRGGKRWPARYFVRRYAWHLLDHVWEIEDRAA